MNDVDKDIASTIASALLFFSQWHFRSNDTLQIYYNWLQGLVLLNLFHGYNASVFVTDSHFDQSQKFISQLASFFVRVGHFDPNSILVTFLELVYVWKLNRAAHIWHQCRKTSVLSCNRCLINNGVEKMNTFKYRLELWSTNVSK